MDVSELHVVGTEVINRLLAERTGADSEYAHIPGLVGSRDLLVRQRIKHAQSIDLAHRCGKLR
jgi:hypothetical protein